MEDEDDWRDANAALVRFGLPAEPADRSSSPRWRSRSGGRPTGTATRRLPQPIALRRLFGPELRESRADDPSRSLTNRRAARDRPAVRIDLINLHDGDVRGLSAQVSQCRRRDVDVRRRRSRAHEQTGDRGRREQKEQVLHLTLPFLVGVPVASRKLFLVGLLRRGLDFQNGDGRRLTAQVPGPGGGYLTYAGAGRAIKRHATTAAGRAEKPGCASRSLPPPRNRVPRRGNDGSGEQTVLVEYCRGNGASVRRFFGTGRRAAPPGSPAGQSGERSTASGH